MGVHVRAGSVGRSARVYRSVKLVFAPNPPGTTTVPVGRRGTKASSWTCTSTALPPLKLRVHTVPYDSTTVLQNNLRHTGMTGFTEYEYTLNDIDGQKCAAGPVGRGRGGDRCAPPSGRLRASSDLSADRPQPQSCSFWSRSASPSIRSEPAGMRMYMSRAISLAVQ